MRANCRPSLAAQAAIVAALMAAIVSGARGDERLNVRVDISLRPVKPDGMTRYYRVAGRTEPIFWDSVFPIQWGDTVEIRANPISGERRIKLCVVRLDGRDIESFRSLPPYEVAIGTPLLAEGWHSVEVFVQQEDSHPLRASGSVRFLIVRTLEDPASAARIAALEKLAAELTRQSAEQKTAHEAEKARLADEQATKVQRHQETLATEPVAAVPPEHRLEGTLTAGGATSIGTLPSGETVVLTGALTSGLGTPLAPVELTAPPAEPRPTRPPIVSALIRVRGGAGESFVLVFKRGDKVLRQTQYQLFANGTFRLPVQMPADVQVFVRWADGRITPANVQPVAKNKGGMQ